MLISLFVLVRGRCK